MQIDNNEIVISGKFVKIVCFKEEWDVDVADPKSILHKLKKHSVKADIFTFRQRVPESKPKFNYYMEWDNAATVPITTYEHWLKYQLNQNPRNKMRIAQKKGVELKISEFNDDLIDGITKIYNETPIRQGRIFPDYNATFEETKKGHSTFLDRADFITAHYKDELIGFIKIVRSDKYARTMGILSKVAHRDKAPMNLLIARAVELCAEKNIPHLVYGKFTYGKKGRDSIQEFKRYLGFESIALPRYFIPLNTWGRIIITLKLHNGIKEIMPRNLIKILLSLRSKWYARKSNSET